MGSPELPTRYTMPEVQNLHIDDLLNRVVELGGSDLHLTSGSEPAARIHGELKRLTEYPVLDNTLIRRLLSVILSPRHRERFETDQELDLSYGVARIGRFRVNVFFQRGSVGAVMRSVPTKLRTLEELGHPPAVAALADYPRGLVLVTGPTGSGKSTTLASLIDIINSSKSLHIMTVEDPIEFLHRHKNCIVNQREVGEDTHSFADALRHVLRQDPDVILVGELRDLETISTAITAAETGHLVFATIHTQDAPQSVDRIVDVFPAHQQEQIRTQLASSLMAVVTQQLVPTANKTGRVCASEILVVTSAVRNLIREGKTHQIMSAMQSGGQYGMQTMDQSLAGLVKSGIITLEAAIDRCASPEDLRRMLGR